MSTTKTSFKDFMDLNGIMYLPSLSSGKSPYLLAPDGFTRTLFIMPVSDVVHCAYKLPLHGHDRLLHKIGGKFAHGHMLFHVNHA
jgi:hypothetical protein